MGIVQLCVCCVVLLMHEKSSKIYATSFLCSIMILNGVPTYMHLPRQNHAYARDCTRPFSDGMKWVLFTLEILQYCARFCEMGAGGKKGEKKKKKKRLG